MKGLGRCVERSDLAAGEERDVELWLGCTDSVRDARQRRCRDVRSGFSLREDQEQ